VAQLKDEEFDLPVDFSFNGDSTQIVKKLPA
jgi:hypothetical protein